MKITGLDYRDNMSGITSSSKVNKSKVNSFANELDNSFSEKSKKDLRDLLDSIKKKGNKIVVTKEHSDVIEYKKLVKQYLNKVMDDMYSLDKCSDTFNSRYYLTVETIDKKLQDLTNKIIGEEKDNISILTTIDEIQGLMIDIYR